MKLITNKKVLIAGIIVTIYFSLLFLNAYVFKSKVVLIGVFQELLTIPMLLLQFVVLFFAVKKIVKNKTLLNPQLLCASLLMSACIIVTLGSFLIN
jgi:hypothetical protein